MMNKCRVIPIIAIVSLLLMTIIASGITVSAVTKDDNSKMQSNSTSAILITDDQGLGDNAFNDEALIGLQKAAKKLKVSTTVLESHSIEDYTINFNQALGISPDLIIASGFMVADATAAAAVQSPSQKFAQIDYVVDAPNVASLLFKEHEGAFLVGVIAGLTTQTDKIGCIIGNGYPMIYKYVFGFQAGIKSVNPDAEVFVDSVGTFTDPDLGYAEAISQFNQGIDIIYHVAGPSGTGVINAAGDRGLWAIGCDVDQSKINPDAVLCSMVKRVDTATYLVIKSVVDGTFSGGVIQYGLAENGVGFSDNAGNVPDGIVAIVKKYEKAIRNGSITVPFDEDTYNDFVNSI